MLAGSTGWSTGPHLHFEIRIKGTPIDSLEFLQNQSQYINKNEEAEEIIEQVNGGEN